MFQEPNTPLRLNVTGNPARFFLIGDWGGLPIFPYRTIVQKKVANFMHKVSNEKDVNFILGLGDNFYFTGVKSVYDKRFHVNFISSYYLFKLNSKNILISRELLKKSTTILTFLGF